VEEVTQKTGNFKKFDTFVKMLKSSLTHGSDTVFADLLTYSDLEMLRSKQTRKPLGNTTKPNNKRYLILTYAVEFDRVHYPLPLAHVDQPSGRELRDTIARLRREIQRLRAAGLPARSSSASSPGGASGGDGEAEELRGLLRQARRERDDAQRDGERARVECAKLARANERLAQDMQRLEDARDADERGREGIALREARRRAAELENELANEREEARQEQAELRHQLVVLQRQLDAKGQAMADLRARARNAGAEADAARRRARLAQDARLDAKRAVYGGPAGPASRPASAERRRPTPPPARPFQRFDPTAYVRAKQAPPPLPPPSRTNLTRLVPPSVLTGHVSR